MDLSIRRRWREQGLARGISGLGFLLSSMSIIIVSIRVLGFIIVKVFHIIIIISSVLSLNNYWNKSWVCCFSVLWFLVSWYEVFSLVGFVYHRVHGSHGNKGLQYEVTCMDLCLIVTKALWFFQVALSDNLLYFIGFGLSYRNSTFILWPGVRKRADYLKKAGLQTTFGSSSGTNLLSWDEDTMWSVDMRGLLWCFGTVYWFRYWDEDFRINFWMQSLCWVSLNPTQRVLAMQKMGLRRQCRSRLMVSNTDTGGLTLSYAMGLWNKVHKVGQLHVRRGIYGAHWIGKIFSMAFTILTIGFVLEYLYSICNLLGCWGYNGSDNGYMGFIKFECYLLVWYNNRNGILDYVYLGTMEILDWQMHEIVHDTVWKIGMELLYDKFLHKDEIWVEHFGLHYTHQIGFSKHIKFVFNESTKLEL